MTDQIAERIVDCILECREKGIKNDELIVKELMTKFDGKENDFYWAIEMMNTGGFIASIMSSGNSYPKSNIKIEDNPILKVAFKKCRIDLKGEAYFINNYGKKKKWWKIF
ncbi:hypothetical protein NBT05_16935 [Aquimarina sp. ERC-38]|uniref:hypothetical protein n=1 Tax=Aquimarina sp. ERC-38 TaxID=2949996 RepID=UPI002246DE60|nr:hypothetical protein [Aquimarina sp. ERC-38]UZO80614.1 hypothetical protein NBT05_16935 [Aquimarina sp. ERC-38]